MSRNSRNDSIRSQDNRRKDTSKQTEKSLYDDEKDDSIINTSQQLGINNVSDTEKSSFDVDVDETQMKDLDRLYAPSTANSFPLHASDTDQPPNNGTAANYADNSSDQSLHADADDDHSFHKQLTELHTQRKATKPATGRVKATQRAKAIQREKAIHGASATHTPHPNVHKLATHPPRQLHQKVVTANNVLQHIQQDYQKCSRLSADYRTKHQQLMEMYMTMNKLLFLWQQGSSADGNITSELMRMVKKSNIIPNEELSALHRTASQVMSKMQAESSNIDEKYFSPSNPMFRDLTDAQQREVMQNKQLRQQILKQRINRMELLKNSNTADERYRTAFSNSYFSDKGDVVNTIWQTDDMLNIGSMNGLFQEYFDNDTPVVWTDVTMFNNLNDMLEAQQRRLVAKAVGLLHDVVYTSNIETVPHIGYLTHTLRDRDKDHLPLKQFTHLQAFLQQHPLLFLNEKDNEEERCADWLQFSSELMRNELDRVLAPLDNALTVSNRGNRYGTKVKLNASGTNVVVLYSEDSKPDEGHRVPLVMDDNDSTVCYIPEVYSTVANEQLTTRLRVASAVEDAKDAGKETLTPHYIAVAGSVQQRVEVVYQLVWRACVELGIAYPVMPSLHFVAGIDTDQLTHQELAFWYNEAKLASHISRVNNEMTDPDYDEAHIKGNYRDLDDDDESFLTWREFLSRDARACIKVDDLCEASSPSVEEHMLTTVAGVYANDSRALNEYCVRLFLHITDEEEKDWLDSTAKPNVTEQAHIIDANRHKAPKPHVDHDNTCYDTYGALMVALYEQLGKTRSCVFSHHTGTVQPREVYEDVENALDMQMELLEHMMTNGLSGDHEVYNKAFFDEAKAHNGKLVFCWLTFKNVFGVPQLSAWKRDVDPACVARELKQTLFLDIIEMKDHAHSHKLDPRLVYDCIDIIHDRAYGASDDTSGHAMVSASMVHLVRLLLWNMGAWNIALNTSTYAKTLERHVDGLIANGYHPFGEEFTIEDVVYGHPSPLLISRVFVVCARYAKCSPKERPALETVFKATYEALVTKIRHPVFLAMMMKFRGHFLNMPQTAFLYKLWYIVDIGLWNQDVDMWRHLLEHALAVEWVANAALYAHCNYFEELKRLNEEVTAHIDNMKEDEIANVRKVLADRFVETPPPNPAPEDANERKRRDTHKKAVRRREGDATI